MRTPMRRLVVMTWLAALAGLPVRGAEVSGRVALPEVCAPEVSPAVVTLERVDGPATGPSAELGRGPAAGGRRAEVALVDQRGLQFVPRVQAIALGQTLRFTNQDS